jgi:HEPN domain-containing protein
MRRGWASALHSPRNLCFDAQQAAEKAIKAVLVHRTIRFPRTHAIADLLSLAAENGVQIPPDVLVATDLTTHAVETRYPGVSESVTHEEWVEAVAIANRVLRWAQAVIRPPGN